MSTTRSSLRLLQCCYRSAYLIPRVSSDQLLQSYKHPPSRRISASTDHQSRYIIISREDFEDKVMHNPDTVIVNFHADWCDPCRELTPVLEKLVDEMGGGKVHIARVEVDQHAALLQDFEVKAVPAVVAIADGQIINKFIGLVDHKTVVDFVKDVAVAAAARGKT